jgi:cytochrome P450
MLSAATPVLPPPEAPAAARWRRPTRAAAPAPVPRLHLPADFGSRPYAHYATWRETAPLLWSDDYFGGAWVLTRHDDVAWALREPRLSARRTGGWLMRNAADRRELRDFQHLLAGALLFRDGPDHTRLRALLQHALRGPMLQAQRPWIAQRVARRLDACDADSGFDLVAELARPLSAEVIARLLGLDVEPAAAWMPACDEISAFLGAAQPDALATRRAQRAALDLAALFERVVAGRTGKPQRNDLLGALLRGQADGRVRDHAELLAQCAMLLVAGLETTRLLLGNAAHLLLRHPAAWLALRTDPGRIPAAVREILRYEAPVQYSARRVAVDLDLHGQRLRRGDLVIALIGSANRDPRRHADPERFDIARRGTPLLSFGSGAHVCLGAALSLLEAETLLGGMLARWPTLHAQQAKWLDSTLHRGLRALHVRADPPPPSRPAETRR